MARADLDRMQRRHWALIVVAAVIAAAFDRRAAFGVLVGGAAMALVVLAYAAAARAVLRRGRPSLAIALLFVKLAAFLGLGWWALASGSEYRPHPLGFAIGLTCFPAAAVWEAWRVRGKWNTDSPGSAGSAPTPM